MATLGTKLTKLRRNKGYSQEQVADILDISQPAYGKYENDATKPGIDMLLKLCEIYEIDLNELFEDSLNNMTVSGNQFEGSNMVANHQHVINMHSPELIENIMTNQENLIKSHENITQLMVSQNRLIEVLIEKLKN